MANVITMGRGGARGLRPQGPPILNASSPQAKGLVAWVPMVGASGPQFNRVTGAALTLGGSALSVRALPDAGAALIPAATTDSLVSTTLPASAANLGSAAAWVYVPDTSRNGCFIHVGGLGTGFGIGIGNAQFYNAGNNLIGLYEFVRWIGGGLTIGTGVHHVAITCGSGGASMYLDGRRVYAPDGSANMIAPSAGWMIHASDGGGNCSAPIGCGVADARVVNYEWSPAEVWALYAPSTRWDLYYVPGRRIYFDVGAASGFKPFWASRSNQILGAQPC